MITRPTVIVNSALVNFNVTSEAVFENIDFVGNTDLAYYTTSGNKGKPIQELPVRFCEQTFEEYSHHGYEVTYLA